VKPKDLLHRTARGDVRNIRFADLERLVLALGFEFDHTSGSHHIYVHPFTKKQLNLQPQGRQAKPYQVRQVLGQVERYSLRVKDES
jgi:predicted RNA binding protein YcfA (HicA-like mRNA interferase family)